MPIRSLAMLVAVLLAAPPGAAAQAAVEVAADGSLDAKLPALLESDDACSEPGCGVELLQVGTARSPNVAEALVQGKASAEGVTSVKSVDKVTQLLTTGQTCVAQHGRCRLNAECCSSSCNSVRRCRSARPGR
mmetsp:Transcript_65115/g.167631  ORF Transcript_65115/g.167631 Transcript_65115/m.167631 type:complete len:133 (-) Transcript_65115:124-522(-)